MSAKSLNVPAVAAVVVVRRRRLDGHTHHLRVRVPVKTAWQTSNVLANERYSTLIVIEFAGGLLVEATDGHAEPRASDFHALPN